ncbi:hypothetical protein, partial [Azotobacter salinestris]
PAYSASAKDSCFIGKLGQGSGCISPESGSLFQDFPEYLKAKHSIARAFRFTSIVPGSENDNKNGKDQWRNRLHSLVESIPGAFPKPDQSGGVHRAVTGAIAGPASSPCTQGNKAMNPA